MHKHHAPYRTCTSLSVSRMIDFHRRCNHGSRIRSVAGSEDHLSLFARRSDSSPISASQAYTVPITCHENAMSMAIRRGDERRCVCSTSKFEWTAQYVDGLIHWRKCDGSIECFALEKYNVKWSIDAPKSIPDGSRLAPGICMVSQSYSKASPYG